MDLYLEVRKMYCRNMANQALGNFELWYLPSAHRRGSKMSKAA